MPRTLQSATPSLGASDLRGAVRALVRRFSLSERADVSCCGMTVAQAATLEALRLQGVQRSGQLGRRLGISPSTLTRNLTRLAERNLIERAPDPRDGRATVICLTPEGRAAAEDIERHEQRFAESVLEQLAPDRRQSAIEGLVELLEAVRRATEQCCPGAYDHLFTDTHPRERSSR